MTLLPGDYCLRLAKETFFFLKQPMLGHILFGFFLDPKPQYITGDKAE